MDSRFQPPYLFFTSYLDTFAAGICFLILFYFRFLPLVSKNRFLIFYLLPILGIPKFDAIFFTFAYFSSSGNRLNTAPNPKALRHEALNVEPIPCKPKGLAYGIFTMTDPKLCVVLTQNCSRSSVRLLRASSTMVCTPKFGASRRNDLRPTCTATWLKQRSH